MATSGKPSRLGGGAGFGRDEALSMGDLPEPASPAVDIITRVGPIDDDTRYDAPNPAVGSNHLNHPICENPGTFTEGLNSTHESIPSGGLENLSNGETRKLQWAFAHREISIPSECTARYRRQIA